MTIIGAITSHGKSAFACNLALDFAKQGKAVLYLSLEMTEQEIHERLFCIDQEVNNVDLRQGRFNEEASERFIQTLSQARRLFVTDSMGYTWEDINEHLESVSVVPDVIIVDYLQAIRNQGSLPKGALDEYLRRFREMTIRHNFAGIIVSQMNTERSVGGKNNEDREPRLFQLKGTGVLEEHADVVLLLYYPRKHGDEDKTKFQVEVAKNRNGPCCHLSCTFLPQYYKFRELSDIEAYTKNMKGFKDG